MKKSDEKPSIKDIKKKLGVGVTKKKKSILKSQQKLDQFELVLKDDSNGVNKKI